MTQTATKSKVQVMADYLRGRIRNYREHAETARWVAEDVGPTDPDYDGWRKRHARYTRLADELETLLREAGETP